MTLPNHVGAGVVWSWVGALASPWKLHKRVLRLGEREPGTHPLGEREGRPYISPPQYRYMKCRDTPCGCPASGCPIFPIIFILGGTTCQTTTI
jgi:hypothetical protein